MKQVAKKNRLQRCFTEDDFHMVRSCLIELNKRGSLIPQHLIRIECPLGLHMLCKLTGSLITENQLRHGLQLILKA